MWHDRTRLALLATLLVALGFTVVLSLRGMDKPAVTPAAPSIDVGHVQTEAVLTFANGLTSTALALPTGTATNTPEVAASAAESTSSTASTPSISPTPSCYRLKFLQDLTIPDNTLMTPAEVFTKTWQVQNTGICAWKSGFKLVLIGGLAMGGSPFTLDASVSPGSKIQISVKMVAPTNQTGIVQGTWRMTDDNGNQFGDALTCVIVIANTSGAVPTPAATATP